MSTVRVHASGLARFGRFLASVAVAATVVAALGSGGAEGRVCAQTRSLPKPDYFAAFGPYHEGDYRNALRAFRNASVLRNPNVWVDSICVHAMAGECLYQMGENALALEQFTVALQIFVANPGWTQRVRFPPLIEPLQSVRAGQAPTWGVPTRQAVFGRFPIRMEFLQGRVDNSAVVQQGGVFARAEVRPVFVDEILRCTALAIRRRADLLGPVGPHDPLTQAVLASVQQPITPVGHWSACWSQCLLGLAQAAAGNRDSAAQQLRASLAAGGRFDHPLTGLALIELGKLAYGAGDFRAAASSFYEATFPATAYDQYDIISEAFQWGLKNHLAAGGRGPYEALPLAAAWADHKSRATQCWLSLAAAENLVAIGDAKNAGGWLDTARNAARRGDLTSGRFGARLNFVVAQLAYLQGGAARAARPLDAALAFQKSNSARLFQISIADVLARKGEITDQIAEGLYDALLADPTAADWRDDPLDTLAYLLNPPAPAMLRWYAATLGRNQPAKALMIADQIRRRRFYSQLPLGGRLLALRWTLEGVEAALPVESVQQRKMLRGAFPDLAALSDRMAALRAQIEALPVAPDAEDDLQKQRKLLKEIQSIAAAQEALLGRIALSRSPSDFVFPPVRPIESLQDSLPEKTAMMVFFEASGTLHGYVVSRDSIMSWRVGETDRVAAAIREFLKRIGNVGRDFAARPSDFAAAPWRPLGAQLLKGLTFGLDKKPWENHDRLIIVPDHVLWYAPLEALPITEDEDAELLLTKVKLSYAPLASLAMPPGDWRPPKADAIRTAIVSERLSPGDRDDVADQTFADLAKAAPNAARLRARDASPGAAVFADQLLVFADLDQKARAVFDWSPLSKDFARSGGTVEDWLRLPIAAPRRVVLPGFHSAAESSLKRGADGSEVFLNACALMASGARTVLLSRWRVGGKSARDLVREFVQELPHTDASGAWQRAVQVTMENEIDPIQEPRIRDEAGEQPMKAAHPFFWSGYLLLDDGVSIEAKPPQ